MYKTISGTEINTGLLTGDSQTLMRIKVPGLAENIAEIRNAVSSVLDRLALSDCERADILLAFGEACNNAVIHGSGRHGGTLEVTCRIEKTGVRPQPSLFEIDVQNQGNGFHPEANAAVYAMPDAENLEDHGRGLPLMRLLMDNVQVLSLGGNTIVRLTKSLK